MKPRAAHDQARARLVEHARVSIEKGSKSFAVASKLFDRETRERVWLLYAWCRRCDDLIDGQDHGGPMGGTFDADIRLSTIRTLTDMAFAGIPSGDPAFDALGVVARECGLTRQMAEDVIAGFELDTQDWRPRHEADMLRYCYHVAGAVGVMMAVVMGVSPQDDDTLDRAADLGIAFQLSNIARDVSDDDAAERCYLPDDWLAEADIPPGEHMKPRFRAALVRQVHRLCALGRQYEASAREGAARLPFRSRWAVLSAAGIYGGIAREVCQAGDHAWDHRISTSKLAKAWHVVAGFWQALSPRSSAATRPRLTRGVLLIHIHEKT